MTYLNVDIEYFDHPDTMRLIGLLGKGAELLPIKLWRFVARFHAEDGILNKYSGKELESFVGWDGKEGECVAALLTTEYLKEDEQGFYIPNWNKHQGHIINFKKRSKLANQVRWKQNKKESLSSPTRNLKSKVEESPHCTKLTNTKPTNNHNLASETSSLADGKDGLNYFINLFKPVNQNLQDIFPNITERKVLQTLLDRHGKKALEEKIKSLEKTYGQPFCTTITKPSELKRHWDTHTGHLKKLETNARASPTVSNLETVENKPSKYANVKITGD